MESFLSGYSKGYTGSVGAGYTGSAAVSGASAPGSASSNGQSADLTQLKPGDTFQGEIISVNGEDVQIQLANGQYMAAKLERDVQVALGQVLNLQVQSNKDNKIVLKPVADGNSQMLRVGEAALRAANMSVNEKNLQLVAKLIENGMPISKNTLMTYNRLAIQNPKVQLSNIIELNKLKLPITEDNARQLENYRNMEHKILEGVKDAANELVKAYESIAGGKPQGSFQNLPALASGAKFMENVLSLIAGESAEDGEAAVQALRSPQGQNAPADIAENGGNIQNTGQTGNTGTIQDNLNVQNKAAAENTGNTGNNGGVENNGIIGNRAAGENNINIINNIKSENNGNIANNTDNINNRSGLDNIKGKNDVNIANNENNTDISNNENNENNENNASISNNGKTENNPASVNNINNINNKNNNINNINIDNSSNVKAGVNARSISHSENMVKTENADRLLTVSDNNTEIKTAQETAQKDRTSADNGNILTGKAETGTNKSTAPDTVTNTVNIPDAAPEDMNTVGVNTSGVNTLKQASQQALKQPQTEAAAAAPETSAVTAGREELKEIINQLKNGNPKNVPERIINYISSGKLDIKGIKQLLSDLDAEKSLTPEQKGKIFDSEPFKRLLKTGLVKRWSLTPEDISREGKVEEFYSRLLKESNRLSRLMNEALHSAANAHAASGTNAKAMGNIAENVEFINQMNQMFNYVQLPLKLGDAQAHGDLYVYTNKKNIAHKDGMLTAFLHLDMDNLGPLDVSIALQAERKQITTKFYLCEDSIKLVGGHIGELIARLEKKGYKCKSMVLEKDEDKTVLEHIEEQVAAGSAVIGYRTFDTRA